MTNSRIGSTLGAMLIGFMLVPGTVRSQEVADDACSDGLPSRPDFGITGMACRCSSEANDDGTRWEFRTEPEILGVQADGPSAGLLRPGDRVVRIDGQLITTPTGGRAWSNVSPGDTVRLRVRRGGGIANVTFVAGGRCPGDSPDGPLPAAESPRLPRLYPDGWLGLGLSCDCSVDTSTGEPRWTFETIPTVIAVAPGSPAAAAGVQPGDVLIRIDAERLDTPKGGAAFSALRPNQEIRLTLERDGRRVTLDVTAARRSERTAYDQEVGL